MHEGLHGASSRASAWELDLLFSGDSRGLLVLGAAVYISANAISAAFLREVCFDLLSVDLTVSPMPFP